ncbi:hypothetical protein [Bradyrhizobium diazoefficiens]|uniref:hypothetical protein n=1 Tax=Bradyrhizobium diazoefficiens TaxID=1355477 RepID=UPI0004BB7E8E|nr:hypothetical protein [Bradyrhizobium diazoefficiens]
MLMRTPAALRGATSGNQPWTPADRQHLADLYMKDPRPGVQEMAVKLGRAPRAIQTEASRLGLNSPGAQPRKCMPCQRMFFSAWIGNRICARCEPMIVGCA